MMFSPVANLMHRPLLEASGKRALIVAEKGDLKAMRVLRRGKEKKSCIHLLESTLTLTVFDLHLSRGLEDPTNALCLLSLALGRLLHGRKFSHSINHLICLKNQVNIGKLLLIHHLETFFLLTYLRDSYLYANSLFTQKFDENLVLKQM